MDRRTLRVVIADADEKALALTCDVVARLGHIVDLRCSSAIKLPDDKHIRQYDLLIADVNSIDIVDVRSVAALLAHQDLPLIMTSASASDDAIDLVDAFRPSAHLVKPISDDCLRAAVSIAVQRFEELKKLHMEASSMRQSLIDRKAIERAKGIVMRLLGLDESSAFKHLQKLARNSRKPLVEIANGIILIDSLHRTASHS
jgi:AmiR/NasT family two-component response regulator